MSAGWGDIAVSNTGNYHTYGVYWEDDLIVFYVDGVETGAFWNNRVMNTPAYMILSLQMGGWDGNTPNSGVNNKVMEVDYVRAWSGTKTTGSKPFAGNRKIFRNKHSEKVLQTESGSAGNQNYSDILQNIGNTAWDSQRWDVISVGSGYYKIESKKSGKAIMPENSSTATNAKIIQFDWSNYNAQKWKFRESNTVGHYQVQNKHSSKVLRPLGGSTANNANISQVPLNTGANSQKWEVSNY